MNDAQRFLESLLKGKPDGLLALVWTLHDKKSRWVKSLAEAVELSKSLCKRDLYIGVGLSPRDFGPTSRCKSDEIAGLLGLWMDIDFNSDAHSKKALPKTIEEALSLIPDEMPPTLIVFSGNGLHLWWLFDQPYVFASEDDRKRAAALALRWQTLITRRGAIKGWAIDRLADLARVLRIPGTVNAKEPKNHKPVTLHAQSGRRYKLADFARYLDLCEIGDPEAEQRAAAALIRRADNDELVIDPEATVQADVLEHHMKSDMRFRNTWNKQRHDLADKSQSGYDLALADFGVNVGMNRQQIVDMIVHHRRLHGSSRANSLDYYQRTISKAGKQSAQTNGASTPLTDCAGPGSQIATVPEDPADEPMRKVRLCEQISSVMGIRFIRISKLVAKDPVYFVDLEQGRVEFPNVRTLITYKTFRETIAAKTNKLIPSFRGKAWNQLAQTMLEACIDIEGTDELQLEGEARCYIARYLSETQFLSSLEGPAGNLQRPLIRDERILVLAADLQMFINKTTMQALSVKQVASMLAAVGATSYRLRGGTFREQSRWALPIEEFDPKDYSNGEEV